MLVRLLAALVLVPLRLLYAVVRFALLLPFPRKVKPYATLRLHGSLPWREPGRMRWRAGKQPSPSLEAIERSLELARKEPGLRGVVVTVEELRADPARLDAVALALSRFRESGKEVVLYWKQAMAHDFALVPAADRILLAPGGMLLLVGHAAAITSLRGGLDKLGILPEFVRIGRWKTAPERFTRPDVSPEQRGFVEEVLDHRQGRLIDELASRRGGDRDWASSVIDEGPYTSRRALDAGLVDALVYPDEIGSFLLANPPDRKGEKRERSRSAPRSPTEETSVSVSGGSSETSASRGSSAPSAISTTQATQATLEAKAAPTATASPSRTKEEQDEGERALQSIGSLRTSRRWRMNWPKVLPRQRIALVPIAGLIKPGHSATFPGFPDFAGERTVSEALHRARKDQRIKGVIVHIDSRGGAAPSSELMWRAVRRCAQVKPTVAYVESVAASGGYFAAAGASRIIAAPGALVGSIGVFSGRFDTRALFDRLGIHREVVLRGANAGLLEPAHSLSDRERLAMSAEIAQIYEEFIDRVAEGRGKDREEIRAVAEGRVFVAESAPGTLVDEIGDLRTALRWVCDQAGLDPRRVDVKLPGGQGLLGSVSEVFHLRSALEGGPLLVWPGAWELD